MRNVRKQLGMLNTHLDQVIREQIQSLQLVVLQPLEVENRSPLTHPFSCSWWCPWSGVR